MEIVYSRKFEKELSKCSKSIKEKFKERMILFIEDEFAPILNNHKLKPPFEYFRSINISGDIRLLYKKTDKYILLARIASHSSLYK